METQSEHWPNLLRTVIQELINKSSTLDLPTLVEGISLMSKLFSRLSPSFNQAESQGFISPLPSQGLEENSFNFAETDGIGHCTELSKTLFSNFVKETVLKDNSSLMLMLGEGPDIDFNLFAKQDNSNSMKENCDVESNFIQADVASTFQVFCQYLVKVSCFPYNSPNRDQGLKN